MFSPLKSKNRERGITLIELVVAGTLVVVITSILLGILIQTQKSAVRGQDQVALESHARSIANEVREVLEKSVDPRSLDMGTTVPLTFSAQQCSLVSSKGFDGKDFYRSTIQTAHDQENGPSNVEIATTVLDSGRTLVAREDNRRLGVEPKRFSSSIAFEYATSVDEAMGRKPSFEPSLKPGEYPKVIRVRIRVEPFGKKSSDKAKQPFELVTAIRTL